MRIPPTLKLVLFDFDGVLAHYSHDLRIAHLAEVSGAAHDRVREVLFDSGLETEYDAGLIDTDEYLDRLGQGVGCTIDHPTWIASRVAGSQADQRVLEHVLAVARHTAVGVLTNNGKLMADAVRRICSPLFPLFDGRILCSGALGVRKPDAEIYRRALTHFECMPQETLFVDDLFVNVQGARAVGLHAETVTDGRSLGKVLKRYALI